MRILLAHKLLKLTGGAEVFFREVGRVLSENGHEVHYLSTGDISDLEGDDQIRSSQITLVDAPQYLEASVFQKIGSIPQVIWSQKAREATKSLIQDFRPDLMHVFGIHVHLSPSILAAAKEANIPTIMTCNDYKHICSNYKLYHHDKLCFDCKGGAFFSAIRNRCSKNNLAVSTVGAIEAYIHSKLKIYDNYVDHYTFSSDFMAQITQEFWPQKNISWSKVVNPFDSQKFTSDGRDDGYGLYFGRLIEEKGVNILIDAAAKIDGFPIKIVGFGQDEKLLRAQSEGLGLSNVEFLGAKWGEDLKPIIANARFVVVPSRWHENFPYVINEAFSLGKPVIGSNRGGITELVADGERGFIYEADDADNLADAIRKLSTSPQLARKMGNSAKVYSDSLFSEEYFYNSLLNAYQRGFDAHSHTRR